MKAIKHDLKLIYQPTNTSCGYAALAMLMSHYGVEVTPDHLLEVLPQPLNEEGQTQGAVTAQLVPWCIEKGFEATMYSFDCQVLDLSWRELTPEQVVERLKLVLPIRDVPGLGTHWSRIYVQAYIDLLKAGANLTIRPHITTKLLYSLLKQGPVYANVCAMVLGGKGRVRVTGLRQSVQDDINGRVSTHSLVIYGHDEAGNFLLADPWSGWRTEAPETVVCAVMAAQIECDNQCFQLSRV